MTASPGRRDQGRDELLCPSARPEMAGAVAFGVRIASDGAARVGYLSATVPADESLLELATPADPLEVFRFAAPCARSGCAHHADGGCSLARRVVEQVPVAVSIAPPCAVRARCLWFAQEGTAACRRCPQVVTHESGANAALARAAEPVVSPATTPFRPVRQES